MRVRIEHEAKAAIGGVQIPPLKLDSHTPIVVLQVLETPASANRTPPI